MHNRSLFFSFVHSAAGKGDAWLAKIMQHIMQSQIKRCNHNDYHLLIFSQTPCPNICLWCSSCLLAGVVAAAKLAFQDQFSGKHCNCLYQRLLSLTEGRVCEAGVREDLGRDHFIRLLHSFRHSNFEFGFFNSEWVLMVILRDSGYFQYWIHFIRFTQ